jgi:hypothetical protein
MKQKKKTGVELIAEERKRQIEVEGWTNIHDSKDHEGGQMAGAAGCYLANALNKSYGCENFRFQGRTTVSFIDGRAIGEFVDGWPWDKEYDKREKHDAIRSLTIAGALIAAELDRLTKSKKRTQSK